MRSSYLSYWGKAAADTGIQGSFHPLAYHSLDVAAVTNVYLQKNPSLLAQLSATLQTTEREIVNLVSFLAACHDLGKFSMGFQSKNATVFSLLFPQCHSTIEESSHSAGGLTTLLNFLHAEWLPHLPAYTANYLLEPLANAACGHHGKPENEHARPLRGRQGKDAQEFFNAVYSYFEVKDVSLVKQFLITKDPAELKKLTTTLQDVSWLIAGVITLCDWIGSNTEFFPYAEPTLSIANYWEVTMAKAHVAVEACGLLEQPVSTNAGFDYLFGQQRAQRDASYNAKTPTPLQQYADTVQLPTEKEPCLFILEDEMGAGKTEAALTLANRLISHGFAKGLYFSLPTQTTANAIFERVTPLIPLFYAEGAHPSTSLAHGNAKLTLARMSQKSGEPGTISKDMISWAQEKSKTALLSDIGVGTIDQLVMAGLPIKHVPLRHLGLANKVVIIDEVHACEPYLLDILKNTLTQHAKLGGSAIILSATLPRATKQELIDAFALGLKSSPTKPLRAKEYPLATSFWRTHQKETPIKARGLPRTITFQRIKTKDVVDLVIKGHEKGQCICIMKNTVSSAQEAYEKFSALFPGEVELVHSRFVLQHRIANDLSLLNSFGKTSSASQRKGRIVIATQVAEQSLDVDFDMMISDLAPMDSLLQRYGRCLRHFRDAHGNPAEQESRSTMPFYIVSPSIEDNPDFMSELQAGTEYVYPMPTVLFRTAQIIQNWGTLTIPSQVREAIEYVYDIEAEVPSFLMKKEDIALGKQLADKQYARTSRLLVAAGYSHKGNITLDERSVTRLGEPSVQIVICDERGKPRFLPKNEQDISLSQLSLRASLLNESRQEDGRIWLKMTEEANGTLCARIASFSGKKGVATYNVSTGFAVHF